MNSLLKIFVLIAIVGFLWTTFGKNHQTQQSDNTVPVNTSVTTTTEPSDNIGFDRNDTDIETETDHPVSSLVTPGETAYAQISCTIPVYNPGPENKFSFDSIEWEYHLSEDELNKIGITENDIDISIYNAQPILKRIWVVSAYASVTGLRLYAPDFGSVDWFGYGDPKYRALNLDGQGIIATGKKEEYEVMERYEAIRVQTFKNAVASIRPGPFSLKARDVVAAYSVDLDISVNTPSDYYERFPKNKIFVSNTVSVVNSFEVTNDSSGRVPSFWTGVSLKSYGKGSGSKKGKLSIGISDCLKGS